MKLTKEQALSYHRQMWSDMQKDLGDNPNWIKRMNYKKKWLRKHFPELVESEYEELIRNNCFLCEYDGKEFEDCVCLIDWPYGKCETYLDESADWRYMPISELLALPKRKN